MPKPTAPKTEAKKLRNSLVIEGDILTDIRAILPQLGVRSVKQFTEMGLKRVFAQIKSGQVVNVNGEFVEVQKQAA